MLRMATRQPGIGDSCPECGGKIGVLNTLAKVLFRYRYLGCKRCGYRPENNKQIVPLEFSPKRERA